MIPTPRAFVVSGPWRQAAWERESAHLTERGIPHELFVGLDNDQMHLDAVDPYVTKDGRPLWNPPYGHGTKTVVGCLRLYMLWKVLTYLPEETFWTMDDDAEFVEDWREKWESAMAVLPDDWDVVYVGSCCCKGKPTRHIGNNLYEVKYPLCGHVLMWRKRCIPYMLAVHQRIWAPIDIAMEYESLPNLKVYTILPRIANQRATPLSP